MCFKNAKVNREKSVTDSYAKDYDIFIDYEGFYAEQILKIHREDFAPEFETKRYTRGFLDVYFQFLHYLYNNKKKELEEEGSFLKKEMFDIIPQLLQLVYLNKTLDWTQEYEQEYTGKDSVEVIEWKYKEDETCTTFKAASRDRDEILKQIYDVMDNNGKCIAIRVAESSEIERGETAVIKPDLVKDWRSIRTIKCLKDEAVAHTKELMEAYSGESCTQNIIQSIGRDMMDWAEEKDRELKESRRSMESFSGFWNILNDFSDAAYAIADTSIAELLEKYEKFEKRYFSFYGNETLLALLYMSNPRKMLDDEGFCRVSYDRENYEKPFVSGEDAKRYEILLVSGLPYEEGDKRNKNDQYLISPINLRIFKEIEKKKAVVLEKADKNKNTTVEIFPYERFRDLIMSDESFGALKKWVYHKQPVKGKYNLYQIHEEYEKYIHEIYNWWTKYGDNI